ILDIQSAPLMPRRLGLRKSIGAVHPAKRLCSSPADQYWGQSIHGALRQTIAAAAARRVFGHLGEKSIRAIVGGAAQSVSDAASQSGCSNNWIGSKQESK